MSFDPPSPEDGSPPFGSPVRSPTGGEWDEAKILADVYENDDDMELWSTHIDAATLLQSFLKRELIREKLKEQITYFKNLKTMATSRTEAVKKSFFEGRKSINRDNLKRILKNKKKQMENNMSTPPFIKTSDKLAFTFGIVVLLVSELILLEYPTFFYQWYTFLLVPLLLARYYTYEKSKFHYFMLDFCYFAQFMLMVFLYLVPHNHIWFQVVFCATTGPLLTGIVMWRNSLVFHDLDKLTSVFIHIFPALVTFALRWYPSRHFSVCSEEEHCTMNYGIVGFLTIFIYVMWQIMYLFKTEVVDGRKLRNDKAIMTSARWMSQVKPHPIWQYFRKRGAKESHAIPVLVAVQLLYTVATLIPTLIVFHSFLLHSLYLAGISLVCIWNGANFYFDVFSETYTKRLKVQMREDSMQEKKEGREEKKKMEEEEQRAQASAST
ncbi:transmembrane protein [Planoprotostelium fungivorum]|uniref:Glycerophosphocholine acyltransferase 1 n=1 Tax=Planoprotostelium fungivorum TaxID=1890364 RepID=A0A2P6N6N2_9EUKA|nr:transmembrane protein [Planoprotostelium fungivorum]